MTYDIRHNEEESRFETTVEGQTAFAEYDMDDEKTIVFTHTIVPDELSGRGIANQLVTKALDYARAKELTVVPQCSFVAGYIERHPEFKDLLRS
jgi:predicted GNAT family acetyltransferase